MFSKATKVGPGRSGGPSGAAGGLPVGPAGPGARRGERRAVGKGEPLGRREPGAEPLGRAAQRLLGVDPPVGRQPGEREGELADDVGVRPRRARRRSDRPWQRSPSSPSRAPRRPPCARAWRRARGRAGPPGSRPSRLAALLPRFSSSHWVSTASTECTPSIPPKTWGWRATSLSWTVAATSPNVKSPSRRARTAWKTTWQSTSPSSSSRWADAASVRRLAELVDRLDRLVALLDEVPHERAVGLRGVPRALVAQGFDDLLEPGELDPDGGGELRQVQAREVVGDDPVDRRESDLLDVLVGTAEPLQDDGDGRRLGDGELDRGEGRRRPDVGNEQRPRVPGRVDVKALAVDEPHAAFDGIDAEPPPGEVAERHPVDDLDVDTVVGEQHPHGRLEDPRRARHGVADAAPRRRGGDDLLDDARVGLGEGGRALVVTVERRGAGRARAARPPDGGRSARTSRRPRRWPRSRPR